MRSICHAMLPVLSAISQHPSLSWHSLGLRRVTLSRVYETHE